MRTHGHFKPPNNSDSDLGLKYFLEVRYKAIDDGYANLIQNFDAVIAAVESLKLIHENPNKTTAAKQFESDLTLLKKFYDKLYQYNMTLLNYTILDTVKKMDAFLTQIENDKTRILHELKVLAEPTIQWRANFANWLPSIIVTLNAHTAKYKGDLVIEYQARTNAITHHNEEPKKKRCLIQ